MNICLFYRIYIYIMTYTHRLYLYIYVYTVKSTYIYICSLIYTTNVPVAISACKRFQTLEWRNARPVSWRFSTKKRFSKTIILHMPLKTNMDTPKWWAERKMYLLLGYCPIFGILNLLESSWPWRLWVQWIVRQLGSNIHQRYCTVWNGNSWYKWQGPAKGGILLGQEWEGVSHC